MSRRPQGFSASDRSASQLAPPSSALAGKPGARSGSGRPPAGSSTRVTTDRRGGYLASDRRPSQLTPPSSAIAARPGGSPLGPPSAATADGSDTAREAVREEQVRLHERLLADREIENLRRDRARLIDELAEARRLIAALRAHGHVPTEAGETDDIPVEAAEETAAAEETDVAIDATDEQAAGEVGYGTFPSERDEGTRAMYGNGP
jgi:hypothetical protein